MKKILTIITISILLSGCKRDPIDTTHGAIITDIEECGTKCAYYSRTTVWFYFFSNSKGVIIDSCGKFIVGDTIKIVKK